MSILSVQGLVKSFGRRRVVDGVDFDVDPGEIVGLLGPNGAGKTTCFRMTCGLIEPDKGIVKIDGQEVTNWAMYRRARDGGMGYLPQQSSVFAKLSAEKNLLAIMELLGMGRKQRKARCDELLEQFKITHIRKSKAGKLSGGERRRLEIARCLVANPKIIMLDEPFAGIDPVTVQNIQSIIRDLSSRGIAILITDHAAREILQITDRTYVISKGRVLCSGTSDEIVENKDVQNSYLGEIDSFTKSNNDEPKVEPPSIAEDTSPTVEELTREQQQQTAREIQSGGPHVSFSERGKRRVRVVPMRNSDL